MAKVTKPRIRSDRKENLHILFVTLAVPCPPTSGQQLRNLGLLQALAREGCKVTLLSLKRPEDVVDPTLHAICQDVEFIDLPTSNGFRSYLKRLASLPTLVPYGVRRLKSFELSAAILRWLARREFAAVICDDIYMMTNLPQDVEVPVLLNKHDLTHVKHRRYLAQEWNALKLGYGWSEYGKVRRWEYWACRHSARMLACSNHDRKLLEGFCPGIPISVLPNVIDTDSWAPMDGRQDDGKTIVYAGAMDWYPNCDAVDFFVTSILPIVRCKVPGVRFVVAGRGASEAFRRKFAAVPSVEFTGRVPDMRTEIAKATVCVVPLRIGSGTRLKILEAGAMAKPVVSTHLGAEGLEFANGREILVHDDPRGFADAVAGLLVDPVRRSALGQAARRRVKRSYSLAVLQKAVRNLFTEMTEDRLSAGEGPGRHVVREKLGEDSPAFANTRSVNTRASRLREGKTL